MTALIALQIVILGIALAVKLAIRKRGAVNQVVLTSKMLVMKSGKNTAGIKLSDIVRITQSSSNAKGLMDVYIKGGQAPVVVLPVTDVAAGIAELTAYASAEGAKLS
jgi:hypothetical protein